MCVFTHTQLCKCVDLEEESVRDMESDAQRANQTNQLFYGERPLTAGNVCALMFPMGCFSADMLMRGEFQVLSGH